MTQLDIAHARLHNQYITGSPLKEPGEVVSWLGAVQAQDYFGAKWSLGLRLQGTLDDDIERAFNKGAILRTHLLRPTWHFVTPADIRWMLALTAPRVHAANAYMYRKLELDSAVFKRSSVALTRALQGGLQLTRDEFRRVLQVAGIEPVVGLRMAYLLMHAELEGIICSGPRRGRQFTYALLEERVPPARTFEHEAALAELARRYFTSRGPATVQDFAKWSGLAVASARRGLEAVQSQLQHAVVGGQPYWFSADRPVKNAGSPTVHLLSIYDEYISGYKDHTAVMDEEIGEKLVALGNALGYIIVLDGRVVGAWRRTIGRNAVVIDINLFTRLTNAENQALVVAAHQYGKFLGLPVVLP